MQYMRKFFIYFGFCYLLSSFSDHGLEALQSDPRGLILLPSPEVMTMMSISEKDCEYSGGCAPCSMRS